jgi:outer membrane protein TolC
MKNWLSLGMVLWCFPAMAQLQFQSLQEVLRYADARAIGIQSADIGEQIASAEKNEAKSYLFPSASVSLGYNDNITLQPTLVPTQFLNPAAPEGTFEELTFGTKYLYSRGLQVQWDILNFQKLFAVKTADLALKESKITTEVNRYNVYNQLASTYYSVLLTQEATRIYEENLQITSSIFENVNEKYQKGIISEAERNQAEIQQLQSQRTLTQAKNNLNQLFIQLQSQLNTNESIIISDKPENFVLQDTTIQLTNPEVFLQEAAVKKYESVLKQTKALRLPSVSLVYQNNQNWATNDFMNFSDANKLPQQVFGAKVSLSGLLTPVTKQKIKQSEWQLQLQQTQLNNIKLVKQQEDQLLQLQLQQAADQLAKTKQILALQGQNDMHAENQYQGGIISLDQRLDKYDDLLTAQNNYLQSLADYTLAQYKIYIRQIDFQPK